MRPMEPTCGKCGGVMTPANARERPELFLHDECLPNELRREKRTVVTCRVCQIGYYAEKGHDCPGDADTGEVAVLEVLVGKDWIEWDRLTLHGGHQWNPGSLDHLKPRTRIRFEKAPK